MTTSPRRRRAVVALPLALAAGVWTVQLTGSGSDSPLTTYIPITGAVAPPPAVTDVPELAIEAPASVSSMRDDAARAGGATGSTQQVAATSRATDIPSGALAAYQRAETVINTADESCNLTWQLIAAIGRVESDHGRFGGSTLDQDGLATPSIIGIALDGTRGTARIRDTDAGEYDDDRAFDRAVGPMQFIPSTWAVAGVDADSDGVRNPQDIDDAALATAVYLCTGKDDLSTTAGQRSSVYRYNHSDAYVDLVLGIAASYAEGGFATVPAGTASAGTIPTTSLPARTMTPFADPTTTADDAVVAFEALVLDQAAPLPTRTPTRLGAEELPPATPVGQPGAEPLDPPVVPGEEPEVPVVAVPPTTAPPQPEAPEPDESEPTGPTGPAEPAEPTQPTGPGQGEPTEEPVTEEPVEAVPPTPEELEALEEATEQCVLEGLVDDPDSDEDEFDLCVLTAITPVEDEVPSPDNTATTATPAGRES